MLISLNNFRKKLLEIARLISRLFPLLKSMLTIIFSVFLDAFDTRRRVCSKRINMTY